MECGHSLCKRFTYYALKFINFGEDVNIFEFICIAIVRFGPLMGNDLSTMFFRSPVNSWLIRCCIVTCDKNCKTYNTVSSILYTVYKSEIGNFYVILTEHLFFLKSSSVDVFSAAYIAARKKTEKVFLACFSITSILENFEKFGASGNQPTFNSITNFCPDERKVP